MMPIENQVCSLNLAKLLKEFGCKQESLFYYIWTVAYTDGNQRDFEEHWEIVYKKPESKFYRNIYSAFTVAELGEMLPDWWTSYRVNKGNAMGEKTRCFWVSESGQNDHKERGLTEVDARAKMLIYLLENGLMGKERG